MSNSTVVRSFSPRRTNQLALSYLSEYGTTEAAVEAVVHGSGLAWEEAEKVCAEIELIGESGNGR